MATQTKLREGTWSMVFPTETRTELKSALFVKRLLAVAVSNITYLRSIFPEAAFGDRSLDGLNLKILKDESSCPGACQMIQWIKGCFDALDKKFLRVLTIGIYTDPDDPQTVIESYSFKFSYTEDNGMDIYRNQKKISSSFSNADTKKAALTLLRTLVVLTQSLSHLPDDVMMTMKLLYYDEVTPADYEPPGFKPSETDAFAYAESPMNIQVGSVSTPFHTVQLKIRTDKKQFEENAPEACDDIIREGTNDLSQSVCDPQTEPSVGDFHMHDPKDAVSPRSDGIDQIVQNSSPKTAEEPGQMNKQPGDPEEASQNMDDDVTEDEEDNGVKCCCGCNEEDGLMILCSKCRYWQHGVCFKITDDNNAPEKHICNQCGNPNNPKLVPTDLSLHGLEELIVEATCLWRRALMACTETNKFMAPGMARRLGVEMPVAQGLMTRLEKEGFLKPGGKTKRHAKIVDGVKLKMGIAKYFKNSSPQRDNEFDDQSIKITDELDSSDVEQLTQRAESLQVSENKRSLLKSTNSSKLKVKSGVTRNKRSRNVVADEDTDFDLSVPVPLEEFSQQSELNEQAKKRKKSSDVFRPMKV